MEKIDFVLPWVGGGDENWRRVRAQYAPDTGSDATASRYRDWDNRSTGSGEWRNLPHG